MSMHRRALALGAAGLWALVAAPAACFFPQYTYDLMSTTSSTGTGGGSMTTTSASTTTTSTTTTGTGGMGPMEDCLNGVDDNGDGKVDCADPECLAGYECVDPVPTGWDAPGYVALYEGPTGMTPPPCPTDLPTTAYTGMGTLQASAAMCSPCGCAPPTGETCDLTGDLDPAKPGLQPMRIKNTDCLTNATNLISLTVPNPPWGGACFHAEMAAGGQLCNGSPCNKSVESLAPTVSGGSCVGTGGTPTKPMPVWAAGSLACSGTRVGKGCTGQQVCQPKPPAPFKGHVCIEQAGDVACPAGPFSSKTVFYGDFTDTRDCTACTCGAASGGNCEITLHLFSDPAVGVCATEVVQLKAGGCALIPANAGIFGWTDAVTKNPSGGGCPPTGQSTPTGSVVPKGPTTFCCL
jgi:hypothetical protein